MLWWYWNAADLLPPYRHYFPPGLSSCSPCTPIQFRSRFLHKRHRIGPPFQGAIPILDIGIKLEMSRGKTPLDF